MRKLLGLVGLLAVVLCPPAQAQIPVTDAGNLTQNIITAANAVVTAGNSVLSVKNQVLELLPLDDIALAVDFLETVSTIGAMVEEGTGLIGDIQTADRQVRVLFGLDNVPRTPVALQLRVNEVNGVIFEARVYATRVQSLIYTLGSALGHLTRLMDQIGILTGNHASNQVLIQQLTLANQTLVTSTAAQMAVQRAETLQQMSRHLVVESLNRMESDSWASWPEGR